MISSSVGMVRTGSTVAVAQTRQATPPLDNGVTVSLALAAETAQTARVQGTADDAAGDTLALIENLVGSSEGDTLTGDDRANTLSGGAGVDTLNGNRGGDTLATVERVIAAESSQGVVASGTIQGLTCLAPYNRKSRNSERIARVELNHDAVDGIGACSGGEVAAECDLVFGFGVAIVRFDGDHQVCAIIAVAFVGEAGVFIIVASHELQGVDEILLNNLADRVGSIAFYEDIGIRAKARR